MKETRYIYLIIKMNNPYGLENNTVRVCKVRKENRGSYGFTYKFLTVYE